MRKSLTAMITICLLMFFSMTAYAETSVTITSDNPAADDGVTVVQWDAVTNEAAAVNQQKSIAGINGDVTGAGSVAATPVAYTRPEPQPVSEESLAENGVVIIKKTYQISADTDPQTLVYPFEQDGFSFVGREILRTKIPGETLSRQADKIAITECDTDDSEEILKIFPDSIDYEEDGYMGRLYLDKSTFDIDADRHENYTYPYTKTREVSGLERNDPSYLEKEWGGMTLSGLEFKQGADGKYTATATYSGTTTGERATGYIAAVTYYGEITKTTPANVLYTVVYEGTPIQAAATPVSPVPAEPELPSTTEPESPTATEPETATPSEPDNTEAAEETLGDLEAEPVGDSTSLAPDTDIFSINISLTDQTAKTMLIILCSAVSVIVVLLFLALISRKNNKHARG